MKTQLTTEQINNAVEMFKNENKETLKITDVLELREKELELKKQGFQYALHIGSILNFTLKWFDSVGRAALQVKTGKKLTKEEFFKSFYGIARSTAYKYLDLANQPDEKIVKYIESEEGLTNPTIEGCLKFCKEKTDKTDTPKQPQLKASFGDKKIVFSPTNELSHCDFTEQELEDTILLLQNALAEVRKVKQA